MMGKRYVFNEIGSRIFQIRCPDPIVLSRTQQCFDRVCLLGEQGRNRWYSGNLHMLKIVLDPTSSIAAIRLEDYDDTICIYYQGQ
jgi:hypothetical protein